VTDPRELDRSDPLASFRSRFVAAAEPLVYFDGNSLGRPVEGTAERLAEFVRRDWGERLIRGWDEGWFDLALTLGDRLGRVALGAGPGQTAFGDSTTVLIYKLVRAAVAAQPDRTEIVIDRDNFPTDRYLVMGIAEECGLTVRWLDVDTSAGATLEQVAEVVGEQTAFVQLSHVSYRSAWVADVPAITRLAHDAGALVIWDLCHSVGSVPTRLDGHPDRRGSRPRHGDGGRRRELRATRAHAGSRGGPPPAGGELPAGPCRAGGGHRAPHVVHGDGCSLGEHGGRGAELLRAARRPARPPAVVVVTGGGTPRSRPAAAGCRVVVSKVIVVQTSFSIAILPRHSQFIDER